MGGEPDDGVRSENAPGQRDRGVVLTDMDSVRPGFERKVGAIVEDERHAGVRADGADQAALSRRGLASRCLSRSCTMSTPPAMQAATKAARSGRSGVQR